MENLCPGVRPRRGVHTRPQRGESVRECVFTSTIYLTTTRSTSILYQRLHSWPHITTHLGVLARLPLILTRLGMLTRLGVSTPLRVLTRTLACQHAPRSACQQRRVDTQDPAPWLMVDHVYRGVMA